MVSKYYRNKQPMVKQPGLSETVAAVEKPTEDTMEEESSMVSTPVTAVKKAAEKRPRTEESEDEGDKSPEAGLLKDIQQILEDGGAGHLFAPIRDKFKQYVEGLLKKQEERIRVEMRQAREKERELDRCWRSVIIHNADRMAIEEENDYIKYTLAEQVTESLHTMCRSMICVMEAYTLGKWKDDKPPTSVCVVLGSARQNGIIFRTIAGNMRAKTSIGKSSVNGKVSDLSFHIISFWAG